METPVEKIMGQQPLKGDLAAHLGNLVRSEINRNADFDLETWIQERVQLKPGEFVLDVGCGNGKQLKSFSPHVGRMGRCVGVDNFSKVPKLAENARKHLAEFENVALVAQDANQPFCFADYTFEAITCCYAIYYFDDIGRVLREFHRLLKHGGRVFVVGPSWDNSEEFYELHKRVSKRGLPKRVAETLRRTNDEVVPLFFESFKDVRISPFVNRVHFAGPDGLDAMRHYYESSMFFGDIPDVRNERTRCVEELLGEVRRQIDECGSYHIIKRAIGISGTRV
jgi:ubiquinone/menaquinone biosynthesis C-methylase UbiE